MTLIQLPLILRRRTERRTITIRFQIMISGAALMRDGARNLFYSKILHLWLTVFFNLPLVHLSINIEFYWFSANFSKSVVFDSLQTVIPRCHSITPIQRLLILRRLIHVETNTMNISPKYYSKWFKDWDRKTWNRRSALYVATIGPLRRSLLLFSIWQSVNQHSYRFYWFRFAFSDFYRFAVTLNVHRHVRVSSNDHFKTGTPASGH